jgi:hypothetical protein
MTGQEFLDAMHKQLMQVGALEKEYTPSDLSRDAAVVGLWYRKPGNYQEQNEAQNADEKAARDEMDQKIGGTK